MTGESTSGENTSAEIIALVGASGVLGRALAPQLVDAGYRVRAIARHPPAAADSIQPVPGDILNAGEMLAALKDCSVVIHAATAVPSPNGGGDWAVNDRIRREGTTNLLTAAAAHGARCYVQQSIAMLSSVSDTRPQTERDPVAGAGVLASAVDMEALVQASPLDWRIIRGGLFFGPGTGREEALLAAAQDPDWAVPGDGSGWLSPVHVDDMAAAMATVIAQGAPNSIYNAVADTPLTWRSLYDSLAAKLAIPPAGNGGTFALPSFRVSNAAIKRIGWTPNSSDLEKSIGR